MQHSPLGYQDVARMIWACRGAPALPFIRVPDATEGDIQKAMDIGALGIIVPMVNTKEEAEAMVRACKYSPDGDRSHSGPRGEFGEAADYRSYLDMVNEELLIIPMIEAQQAIDNIDEILSVPGIDVLLIGPSDLSIELGVPLDYKSDTYQRGLDTIAAACKKHGVVPGMYFIPPDLDPNDLVARGFKFFTQPWAIWAAKGIENGLNGIDR
jgi:4-hydroxy-2-oxoheptanedioate aldolase